jgi:triosephosphate isomerase
MLQGVAGYVIVGHSERRAMFGETDEIVRRKVAAVVAHDLTPIMCLGESLAQRDAGDTEAVITAQAAAGLAGLTDAQVARLIVAYEPIWAIGTGRNATTQQAVEAVSWIRERIQHEFGEAAAGAVRIQYGGSVSSQNCDDLFASPEIDGALVGGASLDTAQFAVIVQAAAT